MVFSFFQARVAAHSSARASSRVLRADESLLLSLHGIRDGLSRGCGGILLPLSSKDLLLVDEGVGGAARHGR
jgi:hypothetical protein